MRSDKVRRRRCHHPLALSWGLDLGAMARLWTLKFLAVYRFCIRVEYSSALLRPPGDRQFSDCCGGCARCRVLVEWRWQRVAWAWCSVDTQCSAASRSSAGAT